LDSDDYLPLRSKFDIHEYSIMQRFGDEVEDAELSNEGILGVRQKIISLIDKKYQ
jgi:hypothetical protein